MFHHYSVGPIRLPCIYFDFPCEIENRSCELSLHHSCDLLFRSVVRSSFEPLSIHFLQLRLCTATLFFGLDPQLLLLTPRFLAWRTYTGFLSFSGPASSGVKQVHPRDSQIGGEMIGTDMKDICLSENLYPGLGGRLSDTEVERGRLVVWTYRL